MDPHLVNLITDSESAELEVILRLVSEHEPVPEGVREVCRFGSIVTARIERDDITRVHGLDNVDSVKVARPIGIDEDFVSSPKFKMDRNSRNLRRNRTVSGNGVVIGSVDFGLDFTHPEFLNPDGTTKLKALWRQGGPSDSQNRYGYGQIFYEDDINKALESNDPFEALNYDGARSDRGNGSHGTHVLSIAGGKNGVAPDADLVFVDLMTRHTKGRRDLGDSLRLLEALNFIFETAGDMPVVCNCSIGGMGGPKDGRALVEQAMDYMLHQKPGRAICQSCGNYRRARTHSSGTLHTGESRVLEWIVDPNDNTPNEMEIWYPGNDEFDVSVTTPEGSEIIHAALGERKILEGTLGRTGVLHHRALDPTNGDNHINIFLDRAAEPGTYEVSLTARSSTAGGFHAWIERDASGKSQSRFASEDVVPEFSIGTICTGHAPIVVGAYDGFTRNREMARFSSEGPTRDGRQKPDLVAPGVSIAGARSRSKRERQTDLVSFQSGTSMATPHVTGAVALVFEAAGRPLSIGETRHAILTNTDPPSEEKPNRYGNGYLNIDATLSMISNTAFSQENEMSNLPEDETFTNLERGCSCANHTALEKSGLSGDESYGGDFGESVEQYDEESEELGLPEDDEEGREGFEEFIEPSPSPNGANAPFAPAFGPGAFWPIASTHPNGRLVSYKTDTGVTIGNRGRIFGASRSGGRRIHVGVDLFGRFGDPVHAIENGTIVNFFGFCCGDVKTSWALFVAHANGVVNYGEVNPNSLSELGLSRGSPVLAGQQIATVGRNPGGSTMIHFETYLPGTQRSHRWMRGRNRPRNLLNPTRALLDLMENGLDPAGRALPLPVTPTFPPVSPPPVIPPSLLAHSCQPGEGPPAALPDPTGAGLHPLIRRGTTRLKSRNPTVGDAQGLLNNFLDALRSGHPQCGAGADIASLRQRLVSIGVSQMTVDCRFGPQTEAVTKLFQRCAFPLDPRQWDGVIGAQTWAKLEPYRTPAVIIPSPPLNPPTPIIPTPPPLVPPLTGSYPIDPLKPYGPRWRTRRPPGLPSGARQSSTVGAAMSAVEQNARAHGLGETFVAVCKNLAQFESRAIYALPANIFDARPPSARPPGKSIVTAWGVFQFNRDAWTALVPPAERASRASFVPAGTAGCSARRGCVYPWDSSPDEEIRRPIEKYSQLFSEIRAAGGSDLAAARGVRLWHASPMVLYPRYLSNGRTSGFEAAWQRVPADRRNRIDGRLTQGGINAEYDYA